MKKQWISVKCGLSRDPKHRQKMGECIWLFLHILDVATWDDGIVRDWKDEAAAEEMGIPIRTLREHRRKLAELEYITCVQKQYTQDVIIHNWTNPREYNGKVYNQLKQGGKETEVQGDTQGYIQGSSQDVTPTYNSNNKESKLPLDWMIQAGQEITQEDADRERIKQEAPIKFEEAFNFGKLPWSSTKQWEAFEKFVIKIYTADPEVFTDYVKWREGDGKYKAFSNKKIRDTPQMFMDTGYPEFEASKMYRKNDRSHGL